MAERLDRRRKMANIIQIKRGEDILTKGITLLEGELALDTKSGVLYAGDKNGAPAEIKGAASGTVSKAETADRLANARLIELIGDVAGSAEFDGSKAIKITAALAEVTQGATVNGITFNSKGLITGAKEVVYKVEDIDGLTEALAGKATVKSVNDLTAEVALKAAKADLEAAEGRIGANEAAIALKADKTELVGLATEEFVNEKIGDIDFSTLAVKSEVETELNKKADKATTYTKTEVDGLIDGVEAEVNKKANSADVYTKTEINTTLEGYATDAELKTVSDNLGTLTGRVTTAEGAIDAVEAAVATKAEAADVYTKTEIDGKVSTINTEIGKKANSATTIAGYGITDAYTKTEVDQKIAGTFKFKGEVASFDKLPTGAAEGDVYQVGDKEYAYDGDSWVELGFNVDLTAYATTEAMNTALSKKLDTATFNSTIANYATTAAMNTELAKKAEKEHTHDMDEVNGLTAALEGKVDDSEFTTLSGKVTANETAIAGKAAKATTLSGYGITDAYTKTEIDNKKFLTAIPAEYVTETELTNKGYATTSAMNTALSSKANSADVYTKSQVYTKTEADAAFITDAELTAKNYATKGTTLASYGITNALATDSVIDGGTF
jgi:hypothetical protein